MLVPRSESVQRWSITMPRIHANARTTPRIRREIQQAPASISHRELARRYGIHRHTVAKWRKRATVEDKSTRPHRLQTTLTEAQELVIVEVRKLLLLPLDDLLVLARTFLNPNLSRSALDRCLRRHGVSNLRILQKERESLEGSPKSTTRQFKAYAPGFIHIDVKYLPQMPDEEQRRYLFVAIDRATRWVYLAIHEEKSAESATRFLANVLANAPFVVRTVLTDNGKEFTDRFSSAGERQPTGHHPFDQLCREKRITHRLIQPRHPQTNGMVERFNGRIAEILRAERFVSAADLQETLTRYLWAYNHRIPQRVLGHMTPIEKLRWWQTERPDLFVSRVDNVTGLDTY
ncbi:tll0721 [Thermosynechococcus vestitus BP-1]|nr:tll0721 [Thermosynechococcus vestitus BP-1]